MKQLLYENLGQSANTSKRRKPSFLITELWLGTKNIKRIAPGMKISLKKSHWNFDEIKKMFRLVITFPFDRITFLAAIATEKLNLTTVGKETA